VEKVKRVAFLLIFSILVVGTIPSFAGRVRSVEDVLELMEKRLPDLKDAKGIQIVKIRFEGHLLTLRNYFKAKIPDKFRIETAIPTPGTTEITKVLCIFDGKVIWHYTSSPEEKRVIKWDLSKAEGTKLANKFIKRFKDSFSLIIPEKIMKLLSAEYKLEFGGSRIFRGKKVYIIRGRAEEVLEEKEIPAPAVVEYYIGADNGFIYRTRAVDERGNLVASIEYKDVEFNTGIPDTDFTFKVPKGAEVFDASEIIKYLAP